MTLQPALATMALKRKPAARGTRAHPLLSTVGSFSLLPSPEFAGDSVVQDACPLVLAAAQASPAAIHEDGQNESRRATTRDGPAAGETAGPWPRCDEPARLLHVGRSD